MPPNQNEKIIGTVSKFESGGYSSSYHPVGTVQSGCCDIKSDVKSLSNGNLYGLLLQKAKEKYGKDYPNFILRNAKWTLKYDYLYYSDEAPVVATCGKCAGESKYYGYILSATVVIPDEQKTSQKESENPLSKAIDKALMGVREGSRIAIDQVRVPSGKNKDDYKDEVVELLLDKGFKVVAKEYLEKLYAEQQSQQSGVYNEKTTVTENNFSAVGFYLNVRLTEESLRVQVINVSTGEYEGNVTVKLQ